MALYTATVWFDLHQILGGDFDPRRTKAYVTTNVENGTLIDESTGEIRMGDQTVTINSDGTGEFTTWSTIDTTDGNPTSWQTSLHLDYARGGRRDRECRVFGPYTISHTVRTVTNKALTSNVATIGVDAPHGLRVGDTVLISEVDATFNGSYTITAVPSTTSVSYAKTAADVAPVAATGSFISEYVSLALLEEEQAVPPAYLTTVTTLLDGYVAEAEGHADDAQAAAATAAADAAAGVAAETAADVTAAQAARNGAETARDEAEAARDTATEIALGDAEAAFDGFLLARDLPADGDELSASTVARVARTKHAPALGLFFPEAETPGGSDDTVAIQAACAAAAGEGTVYFQGAYTVSSAITLTNGAVIKGDGAQTTSITSTHGGAIFASATPGTRTYTWVVDGIKLIGPGSGTAGSAGFDLDSVSSARLADVVVSGFEKGIRIHSSVNGGAVYNRFTNVTASACGTGFAIEASGSNATILDHCRAADNAVGVDVTDSDDILLLGCQIEGNTTVGFRAAASVNGASDHCAAIGTRFEGNTLAWHTTSANVRDFAIINPHIFGTYTYTDSGTRTMLIQGASAQSLYQTNLASANGSWRFVRLTSANSGEPAVVFRDNSSSSTDPLVAQFELASGTGFGHFIKGLTAGVLQWGVTAAGLVFGNLFRAGPSVVTPSGITGTVKFLASSTADNDSICYALYVNDGSNNRRASFFLDDSAGEFGVSTSLSAGSLPFVVKLIGTNRVTVDTTTTTVNGIAKANKFADVKVTPTFAAAQTVDFSSAGYAELTLTGNITSLAFSGGVADTMVELHLIQDGTGSRTLSGAAASIKWAGGTAPTLTTTAGRRDIFRFRNNGSAWLEVSRSMNVG